MIPPSDDDPLLDDLVEDEAEARACRTHAQRRMEEVEVRLTALVVRRNEALGRAAQAWAPLVRFVVGICAFTTVTVAEFFVTLPAGCLMASTDPDSLASDPPLIVAIALATTLFGTGWSELLGYGVIVGGRSWLTGVDAETGPSVENGVIASLAIAGLGGWAYAVAHARVDLLSAGNEHVYMADARLLFAGLFTVGAALLAGVAAKASHDAFTEFINLTNEGVSAVVETWANQGARASLREAADWWHARVIQLRQAFRALAGAPSLLDGDLRVQPAAKRSWMELPWRRIVATAMPVVAIGAVAAWLFLATGCAPREREDHAHRILVDVSGSMYTCGGQRCEPDGLVAIVGQVLAAGRVEGTTLEVDAIALKGALTELHRSTVPTSFHGDLTAKASYPKTLHDDVGAILLIKDEEASEVFAAIWQGARELSQEDATARDLWVWSDLRDPVLVTNKNGRFVVVPVEKAVQSVTAAGPMPDLRGIAVHVCGVGSRAVDGSWSLKQTVQIEAAAKEVFTAAGAASVEIREKCAK